MYNKSPEETCFKLFYRASNILWLRAFNDAKKLDCLQSRRGGSVIMGRPLHFRPKPWVYKSPLFCKDNAPIQTFAFFPFSIFMSNCIQTRKRFLLLCRIFGIKSEMLGLFPPPIQMSGLLISKHRNPKLQYVLAFVSIEKWFHLQFSCFKGKEKCKKIPLRASPHINKGLEAIPGQYISQKGINGGKVWNDEGGARNIIC